MINSIESNGNTDTISLFGKLCTINICGLSQRSNMMLGKFTHDKDILLLGVQETGTNKQWRSLPNMKTYIDTNNQLNKGCAIMVKNDAMFTQLPELSKMSSGIDSVWGMLSWNGKRYIIGNVYLKLDYLSGVKDFLKMLDCAHNLSRHHRCAGVIAMGDFNARHYIWNDNVVNKYGKFIEENMDWSRFCVQAPSSCTFLAKNGSSHIDFFITSTQLDNFVGETTADHFVNLYSGAPIRGHVPVIMGLKTKVPNQKTELKKKLDLSSIDWFNWTRDIEVALSSQRIDDLSNDEDFTKLWETINSIIEAATKENCQTKVISNHSKPYWTKELSQLSQNLSNSLKAYLTRNTDDAFAAYETSKDAFEEERQRACQKFIMDKTKNLNRSQANRFWKEFDRLFKPPSDQMVEALIRKDGTILTDNKEIEFEMFQTFFEARHIEESANKFNNQFYNEVNSLYEEIKEGGFQPNPHCQDSFQESSALYNPITEWEIMTAIKSIKSPAASFDNCQFHPSMLKHLESNAILALSRLFTLCLRNGKWIWNNSNIIFLKKDGKQSYSVPGAYRPITISSYIGKLMERILAHRLEKYLSKIGMIDENQEGFSKGRNTIRYLHRLTAGIKGDILKKLTVICLFIDFEKAFDSVWKKGLIVKLWNVGVHGCYLRTIDSFLFGRTVVY